MIFLRLKPIFLDESKNVWAKLKLTWGKFGWIGANKAKVIIFGQI